MEQVNFFACGLCLKHNRRDNVEASTTYTSKTLEHKNVTITIRRPVLERGEREKRAKQIVDGLSCSLRDYLLQTTAVSTLKGE